MSYLTDKILEELLDNIPDGPEKEPKRKVNTYAAVQEQNNKHNEGRLTQAQIIEDFIRRLLDDPIDEEEEDEYDPNVLDPAIVFQEDTKFINGIKKMPNAYKELKSASRPPMVSEDKKANKEYLCLKVYNIDGTTSRIIIPGTAEIFHIKASELKKWLKNGMDNGGMHVGNNEAQRIVEVKVSKKFLLSRNKKRK